MWAIILVVTRALLALHARPDLGSNTDAVSHLAPGHLIANLDSMTNDLVADANGKRDSAPAAGEGVNIGAADTAALDLDVDVVGSEPLSFELCRWLACSSEERVGAVADEPLAS